MIVYFTIIMIMDDLEISQWFCAEIFWNTKNCGTVFSKLLFSKNKKKVEQYINKCQNCQLNKYLIYTLYKYI